MKTPPLHRAGTIRLFDTTLRDGAQGQGVSFSVDDKLRVCRALDALGIHYIEGGWPGSNPKDVLFFSKARRQRLRHARLVAFGSTRRKDVRPANDPNLRALVAARTRAVCIFGKSWLLHVRHALRTTPEENLRMIADSVRFLRRRGLEVIYDAEHFFDGYRSDPRYALATLRAAEDAGAQCLTLCDTNGGMLPHEIESVVRTVRTAVRAPLGIHAHNDSEAGVANSLAAVRAGATLIQGTINGYGERCGNANLCSIIPNLQIKMGLRVVTDRQLRSLTETSRYIGEMANLVPNEHLPYVGRAAFAHKGGVHVSAMQRHSGTYEHVAPALVGNQRRILMSELSGRANVVLKARELNVDFTRDSTAAQKVLAAVKSLEHQGYLFEGAEGSLAILMRKLTGRHKTFFELEGFRVLAEKDERGRSSCWAMIKVKVRGREAVTAAEGTGPVDALNHALRRALERFYPKLRDVALTDYKVRVINAEAATGAKVRVLIQSRDQSEEWGTVGVSENILEASWQALVDSIEYKLLKGGHV